MANQAIEFDLSVRIGKLDLRTPIILASGCCGYGIELNRIVDFPWYAVGAVVLKSITLYPRMGKPPPRIAEVTSGMLNAIGVQNDGVELFLSKIAPNLGKLPCPAIASIIGESVEQYHKLAKELRGCRTLAAIEVNISSPNIERGGMEFGVDPDAAYEVVSAVRSAWDAEKDVWVKLSPHATDIATIAERCINAGANVLSLINTVPAMALDVRSFPPRPLLGANMGGLSGPAIKPIAIRKVYEVARWMRASNHRVPIIGIGGIWTANDIIEFLAVGANAVQVGTLLFHNPHAPRELCDGLKRYMNWVYSLTGDEKWLCIRHYTGCAALNAQRGNANKDEG